MATVKGEQRRKFIEAAKSVGADDGHESFDKALRRVVSAKPTKKQKSKKPAK